jgi:hypothetical protein
VGGALLATMRAPSRAGGGCLDLRLAIRAEDAAAGHRVAIGYSLLAPGYSLTIRCVDAYGQYVIRVAPELKTSREVRASGGPLTQQLGKYRQMIRSPAAEAVGVKLRAAALFQALRLTYPYADLFIGGLIQSRKRVRDERPVAVFSARINSCDA